MGSLFNPKTLLFDLNESFSLIMNTISGAIDIIPCRCMMGHITSEERMILGRRGYSSLWREEPVLRELFAYQQQEHSQGIPYWFYVLTTLRCNFACSICYERKILAKADLSPELLGNIGGFVKKFQEENKISPNRINLVAFGGEPLLAPDGSIIRRILDLSSVNGWKSVIITNGSKVMDFMDLFWEFKQTISDFRITLEGPQFIHDSRRPFRGGKGSSQGVVSAIDVLLDHGHQVKMQTILGGGNLAYLEELASLIEKWGWLDRPNFQWRIEGSHDYANLDSNKDEITEGRMVQGVIDLWNKNPKLRGKLKFESFKYLGHIAHSFGWLGDYKTYWGPKFSFCEPQKGFQYIFSTDGKIYHCPRTINNPDFCIGEATGGFSEKKDELKGQSILEKKQCLACPVNTLCGGGCVVRKKFYPDLNCQGHALAVIKDFVGIMKGEILQKARPNKIVSINDHWIDKIRQ
jgi:uncharacterized protein